MQGCKVSTLPDGPRNVERRSACDRRPTKSQGPHAQCALKIGPGFAIPGARAGPEHSVWAPLSSLSWSLTGVTAARAGRLPPRRARPRGPRQTRAKRVPCEARPDGRRRVAPSGPGPSTCSPACVRPCLHHAPGQSFAFLLSFFLIPGAVREKKKTFEYEMKHLVVMFVCAVLPSALCIPSPIPVSLNEYPSHARLATTARSAPLAPGPGWCVFGEV